MSQRLTRNSDRPRVLIDPSFRAMDEIFDPAAIARLAETAEIVWGRDEPMPADLLRAELPHASAVVFGSWRHGPDVLDHVGPGFLAMLEVAGGHEHEGIGYEQLLDRGVLVGSCAPAFGPVVAEHGLALALALRRGVVAADQAMRSGTEVWLHDGNQTNRSLFGASIGFIGCGGISRHLQSLLEPFGPSLLGYDPFLAADELRRRGVASVGLGDLFETADLIFVLAAPTRTNRGLVSRELLGRLRKQQGVVVLSRASVVDFDALVELSETIGFGFATDVYPVEPLPRDDHTRHTSHSILTPHLAGALPEALRSIGRMVVDDLLDILAARPPSRMQYLTAANRSGLVQATPPRSGIVSSTGAQG